ncbi:MAG TPA: DUF1330 domain-containing protein [Mycobacteriales bacterium]|nr:DUF1330 domain-containing protein [Mycobacteriales bacterium]
MRCTRPELVRYPRLPRVSCAGYEEEIVAKAYWINMVIAIHDQAKLDAYVALAGPAMEAAGGRFLARGVPAAAFERGTTERTTLIEFGSVDEAVAAYHSAAYQEALRALDGGVDREIRIIEAID